MRMNPTIYQINLSDPNRKTFDVPRKKLDGPGSTTASSILHLYGRGALEWGEYVDENFIHLLENSAGATEPEPAIPGQLWHSQYLYWRDVTVKIELKGEDEFGREIKDGAFFVYDIDSHTWIELNGVLLSTPELLDGTGRVPNGTYVYDEVEDILYKQFKRYDIVDTSIYPRLMTRANRPPTVDDIPDNRVLKYTATGIWTPLGVHRADSSLSYNLNELNSHFEVGMYYQNLPIQATTNNNYPIAKLTGSLVVLPTSNNLVKQIYISDTGRIFGRHNLSDVNWTEWVEYNHFDSIKGLPPAYTPTPHTHNYYRDITDRPNNTGMITMWPVDSLPPHVILCDGRDLDRIQYAELYSKIGTKYGSSSSSTFKVPDYRDMFLRHPKDGRDVGNVQDDMIKSHNHGAHSEMDGKHNHDITVEVSGAHGHNGTALSDGAHSHRVSVDSGGSHGHGINIRSGGGHTHSLSINSGGSHSHSVYSNSATIRAHISGGGGNPWSVAQRYGSYEVKNLGGGGGSTNTAGSHSHSGTAQNGGAHTHTGEVVVGGSHTHTGTALNDGRHTHSVTIPVGSAHSHLAKSALDGLHNHNITIDDTGGYETRPKNVAVVYAIVAYS